jgi:hypothetical protein
LDKIILCGDRVIDQRGPGLALDVETGAPVRRAHPVTGEDVPWEFWRIGLHCNYAVAGSHVLTFRSNSAAFADLATGLTYNLHGFRGGCRNSLIPADGVLAAPNFASGCICSYSVFTSLALVHRPENEMWGYSPYQPVRSDVQRVGINLGAPGDRTSDDGTLWLHFPRWTGAGPPIVETVMEPAAPRRFLKHAAQVRGPGLPWVAASGCEGLRSLTIRVSDQDRPRRYRVRLHFIEPRFDAPGARIFSVIMEGRRALENLDIIRKTGGPDRILVEELKDVECRGSLHVTMEAGRGEPVLCGIEILSENPVRPAEPSSSASSPP